MLSFYFWEFAHMRQDFHELVCMDKLRPLMMNLILKVYCRYIVILQALKRCIQQSRAIMNGMARLSLLSGLRQGRNL